MKTSLRGTLTVGAFFVVGTYIFGWHRAAHVFGREAFKATQKANFKK